MFLFGFAKSAFYELESKREPELGNSRNRNRNKWLRFPNTAHSHLVPTGSTLHYCPWAQLRAPALEKTIQVLRIRDAYPGSRFLPIPDPGSRIQKQQQKIRVKKIIKFVFKPFFCSHKFHKIDYFIF
jgi:hypothetical protein